MVMRDEALLHFHLGSAISVGVHIGHDGAKTPALVSEAASYLDPGHPGRSAVGFCASHPNMIVDLTPPPPKGWQDWQFWDWDNWFGRINGVFLVDLEKLQITQYPLYSCASQTVPCDFSRLPRRLVPVANWL